MKPTAEIKQILTAIGSSQRGARRRAAPDANRNTTEDPIDGAIAASKHNDRHLRTQTRVHRIKTKLKRLEGKRYKVTLTPAREPDGNVRTEIYFGNQEPPSGTVFGIGGKKWIVGTATPVRGTTLQFGDITWCWL